LFKNAFCPSCVNCEQLLQQAQAALSLTKPMQRPIFSLKAIANGSLHAMLELCGRRQLLQSNPSLIASSCIAGMLMYSQAIITGSAAAASDAVQILKSLAPLHAAALSLLPAADAAAKHIVLRTGAAAELPHTQLCLPLVAQLADHVFAAARLFSDSVGLHVSSLCLQLLQGSAGVDDQLRSVVVVILAAVHRSNCTAPLFPPVSICLQRLLSFGQTEWLVPPSVSRFRRRRYRPAPQGDDICNPTLHAHVPGVRGQTRLLQSCNPPPLRRLIVVRSWLHASP
jgi:hypothetical protein